MLRALLVVAREIALAHDNWLAKLARLRPLAAENAALRGTVERQRAQIGLLRARLLRLDARPPALPRMGAARDPVASGALRTLRLRHGPRVRAPIQT